MSSTVSGLQSRILLHDLSDASEESDAAEIRLHTLRALDSQLCQVISAFTRALTSPYCLTASVDARSVTASCRLGSDHVICLVL